MQKMVGCCGMINYGNMQIGDYNIINDYRNEADENQWKILEDIVNKQKSISENSSTEGVLNQTHQCVRKRDREGIKNIVNKYGAQFISSVLCNVASTEIANLLAWILA